MLNPVRLLASAIVFVVAVGFGGYKLLSNVGHAVDRVEQATGSMTSSADAGDSLIRASNFRTAIDKVRAEIGPDGEILSLRLTPGEAAFQARKGDERAAEGFTVTKDGDVREFGVDLIGDGRIEDNVFPLARLNARTPERIVAAIARRDPRYALKDVQFMTLELDAATGRFEWSVNIGDPGSGRLYQADLDGANVRTPGEATPAVPAKGSRTGIADPSTAQGIAACIRAAGGDVAKIQACTP